MRDRFKLLFIIPSLEAGGAQKVLSILLQNISKQYFDCTLCVLTNTGEFYNDIPEEVKKISLEISRVRYSFLKLYKFIKQSDPHLVFVFDVNNLNPIIGIMSLFLPSRIKYITREAMVLSTFLESYNTFVSLRKLIYKFTLQRFDSIVAQSSYMKEDLIANFKVTPESVIVINNPIDTALLKKLSYTEKRLLPENKLNLIAVGRIVYVKGYDLLIKALSLVKSLDFHLTILGEKTPENPGYREEVMELVTRHGLTDKISFLGFTDNPYRYIKQSDLLIVSSRTEAFSNAAIECNAIGIPIIAFNSPGGMSEIITEDFNGWLVENGNIEKLANSISTKALLKTDRKRIAEHAYNQYDISRIIPEYEKTILNILNNDSSIQPN